VSGDHAAALARFRQFYDEFSAPWLDRLEELYAPGFAFKDAFHEINGDFAALRAYFERVLTALAYNKFTVEDVASGSDGSYVRWRWEWKRRAGDPINASIGVTHLRLDAAGRITHHHDLFDAAEGFYEKLPVIGGMLRMIKRRL